MARSLADIEPNDALAGMICMAEIVFDRVFKDFGGTPVVEDVTLTVKKASSASLSALRAAASPPSSAWSRDSETVSQVRSVSAAPAPMTCPRPGAVRDGVPDLCVVPAYDHRTRTSPSA